MPIDITAVHSQVNARNNASRVTLLQGAVEGHVLVKNSNHALPLKSPKSLSIYGYDAKRPDTVVPTSSPYGPWGLGYTAFNFLSIIDNLLGIPNPNVISQIAPYGTLLRYESNIKSMKNANTWLVVVVAQPLLLYIGMHLSMHYNSEHVLTARSSFGTSLPSTPRQVYMRILMLVWYSSTLMQQRVSIDLVYMMTFRMPWFSTWVDFSC